MLGTSPTELIGESPTEQFKWTDERVAQFKDLYAQGLSHREIGAVLGISRNACIGKAQRLGLEPRRSLTRQPKPRVDAKVSERTWRRRRAKAHPRPFVLDEARFVTDMAIDLPPALPPVTAVFLRELEPYHCRWPLGEPTADMLFCGANKAWDNKRGQWCSYCSFHCWMAYCNTKHYGTTPQAQASRRRVFAPTISALRSLGDADDASA